METVLVETEPTTRTGELLDRWRRDLAAWAIPDEIMAGTTDSPWVLPCQVFARRADRQVATPGGPSFARAFEALDPPGEVLDVGAGAGAACLPLAERASRITAVDVEPAMLAAFAERAAALRVPHGVVAGRWPQAAVEAPVADVVTCHHVLYNVADLKPFVAALVRHARRRVVVEVTACHPLSSLNPLWLRFHDLRRPEAPTADDLLAVLSALGLRPEHERWLRPAEPEHGDFADLVDVTRRRLCLPPERAEEVAAALVESGVRPGQPPDLGSSGRELVTIWFSPP
ncbi:MAG TPA: methyltransferase domain-containing protein [Micromonosporaceae bacterium]|nr:methyltransferase domain-containing protein [Micromonosporaceae bacterium]